MDARSAATGWVLVTVPGLVVSVWLSVAGFGLEVKIADDTPEKAYCQLTRQVLRLPLPDIS